MLVSWEATSEFQELLCLLRARALAHSTLHSEVCTDYWILLGNQLSWASTYLWPCSKMLGVYRDIHVHQRGGFAMLFGIPPFKNCERHGNRPHSCAPFQFLSYSSWIFYSNDLNQLTQKWFKCQKKCMWNARILNTILAQILIHEVDTLWFPRNFPLTHLHFPFGKIMNLFSLFKQRSRVAVVEIRTGNLDFDTITKLLPLQQRKNSFSWKLHFGQF